MTDSGARVAAQIVEELRAIEPVDERERTSIASAISFLTTASHPFSEMASPSHITASAFVVSDRGVILHRHRILGRWLQPGGHVDGDESPEEAAVREVREETGLIAIPLTNGVFHVDMHPGPHEHTHYDLRYLLAASPDDPSPAAGESAEVVWCAFDEIETFAEPELRPALAKVTATVRALARGTLES